MVSELSLLSEHDIEPFFKLNITISSNILNVCRIIVAVGEEERSRKTAARDPLVILPSLSNSNLGDSVGHDLARSQSMVSRYPGKELPGKSMTTVTKTRRQGTHRFRLWPLVYRS